MTDCSKTAEFLAALGRMCNKIRVEDGCKVCAISADNNGTVYHCGRYIWERPEEATRIVQEWADAHPAQSWRRKLLEALPEVDDKRIADDFCPGRFFHAAPLVIDGRCNCSCADCWDQEAR